MSIELKPVSPSSGAYEAGLKFKSRTDGADEVPAVDIAQSALPTGAATLAEQQTQTEQLQSMNVLSDVVWDNVKITYTDATKATIQKVEWFLGVTLVRTFTPTFAATTDTWVKS